jgi:hypothetical protein
MTALTGPADAHPISHRSRRGLTHAIKYSGESVTKTCPTCDDLARYCEVFCNAIDSRAAGALRGIALSHHILHYANIMHRFCAERKRTD